MPDTCDLINSIASMEDLSLVKAALASVQMEVSAAQGLIFPHPKLHRTVSKNVSKGVRLVLVRVVAVLA